MKEIKCEGLLRLAAGLAATAVGVIHFSHAVNGFGARIFLLLASVHLLVAVYSVVFVGTMAVFFRHNGADMHAPILALSILVGCAFLGFFEPRFRTPSLLNPNAETSVARRVWLFVPSVAF